MKFLKPKIKKPKAPGKPRKIGNRTIIGIVCIIAAFAVCFGVAPLVMVSVPRGNIPERKKL